MKKLCILIIVSVFVFCACSKIPNKPIYEALDTKELSDAIKSDTLFLSFYTAVQEIVDDLDEIEKATYNDITYRRLFDYSKFLTDTTYWKPLHEKWEKEWESKYKHYDRDADSIITHWKKYKEENSLDKYVKIELAKIDKEYYSYTGGIKDVNLGFRLTPLQGKIEQLAFSYGYQAKLYEDNAYYEKHRCQTTTPLLTSVIRYWEVGYSDRKTFANHNVETFLRDHNLYIEITALRKDGVNISVDDISIPKTVSKCLEYENKYPSLYELFKDDVIKEFVYKEYLTEREYINNNADMIRKEKDELCFDFAKSIENKALQKKK